MKACIHSKHRQELSSINGLEHTPQETLLYVHVDYDFIIVECFQTIRPFLEITNSLQPSNFPKDLFAFYNCQY